jgi:hypothetical protein
VQRRLFAGELFFFFFHRRQLKLGRASHTSSADGRRIYASLVRGTVLVRALPP